MRRLAHRLRSVFSAARRGERLPLGERWRTVIKIALVFPLLGLLALIGFVSVSSSPRFCYTCHYMRPFYQAWEKSSHNHVACVDCHIPPGVKSWIEHKFAASVQLVKYVTRQYGTKPWTEVEDSSCLRAGCHETRLLAGKTNFGGVAFDHAPHLTSFRRVTRLRCTSCHAQVVQGTHITVTESTCFLCHFKHSEKEPRMADCRLCHDEIRPHRRTDIISEAWAKEPEATPPVTAPKYDHKELQGRAIDCRECHSDVVEGTGTVPRQRCLTCHVEPERLNKYDDVLFMHRTHVTDHKVDCQRCHQEITHKLPPKETTAALDCSKCHPGQHGEVSSLYAGQGGHGAESVANPMYDKRVPCEGCHKSHREVDGRRITTGASAAGCMLCHGERYGADLARWQAEAAAWERWAADALAASRASLAGARPDAAAKTRLARAAENVKLVRNGHYVHNPDYAVRLLRAARDEANAALAAAGAGYRWPPEPPRASTGGDTRRCRTCHANIASQSGYAFGAVFDHGQHLGGAHLDCDRCHASGDRPEAEGHGRLVIGGDGCRACHEQRSMKSPHEPGWQVLHGAQSRANPGVCATCHSQGSCDACHGTRIPHAPDWPRRHGAVAKRPGTCEKCHRSSFCAACHRSARPSDHSSAWPKTHGAAAKKNRDRCATCHQPTYCRSCHGLDLPHPREFRSDHGARAAAQPAQCARCHNTADCERCHRSSPPASHKAADWAKTHGERGQENPLLCRQCHGKDSCMACHGVAMPHPDDWAVRSHGPVAARNKELCGRCHQSGYCRQCHVEDGGS